MVTTVFLKGAQLTDTR